jgi:hypothetical protein
MTFYYVPSHAFPQFFISDSCYRSVLTVAHDDDDEAYCNCNDMHGNIGLEKNEWKVAEDETVIIDPSDRKVSLDCCIQIDF